MFVCKIERANFRPLEKDSFDKCQKNRNLKCSGQSSTI